MSSYEAIQYFETRDVNYYQSLIETLDLQSLKDSAIEIVKDGKPTKMIRIDYCGSAASTFLQPSKANSEQRKLFHKVEELFTRMESVIKEGYTFRTRFLFIYPYSDFAFTKIEAEQWRFRPTIEQPKVPHETVKLFSHSAEDFFGSDFFIKQRESLYQIQRLFNKYCRGIQERDLISIRFTCIPINVRFISINNTVFTDPYLYARQNEHERSLSKVLMIRIDRTATSTVKVYEDHFRYIWTHPTTLLYEDATFAKKNHGTYLEGLADFKEPHKVNFDNKVQRYKSYYEKVEDTTLNLWKFQAERSFLRVTRSLESIPQTETLFIAFSFENGKKIADSLKEFISEDFPEHLLRVNVVDLDSANSTLYSELIKKMDESTMAVILFTKDIAQQKEISISYYSKPNILFEFGYLLAHLSKFGNSIKRITVFVEDGLSIGTDIQDIGRFPISSNEIENYKVVVERIVRAHTAINIINGEIIIQNCLNRIQHFYDQRKLDNVLDRKLIADYKNEFRVKITRILTERFK